MAAVVGMGVVAVVAKAMITDVVVAGAVVVGAVVVVVVAVAAAVVVGVASAADERADGRGVLGAARGGLPSAPHARPVDARPRGTPPASTHSSAVTHAPR